MTSSTRRPFWDMFWALPPVARFQARAAFHRFRVTPHHPDLHFKRLGGHPRCWYVRITRDYRAVAVREGETLIWFWIGNHHEFDRLFG